jgi:threonine/homoserine/homoserine lactone efflux protein
MSLVSTAAAVGIATTARGIVLIPGPNMVFLVSRSVGQGRLAGLVSPMGTLVGFVVYLVIVNLGLAVVFVAVPSLYGGEMRGSALHQLPGVPGITLQPARTIPDRAVRRDSLIKLFGMGSVQIAVSLIVNAAIVVGAEWLFASLAGRPGWAIWQRRITGSVLGAVAVLMSLPRLVPGSAVSRPSPYS